MLLKERFYDVGVFLLTILISGVLCLQVEQFITTQEVNKNKEIALSIATDILNIEQQIDKRLKASILLTDNLLKNRNYQYSNEFLKEIAKVVDVERITVYTGEQGRPVAATDDWVFKDPEKIEFLKTYSVFDRINNSEAFKSKHHNINIGSIGRNSVTRVVSKSILLWNKEQNFVLGAAIEISIADILKKHIEHHEHLSLIRMSSPSGNTIIDNLDSKDENAIPPVNQYTKEMIVKNDKNKIGIQFAFGELKQKDAFTSVNKTANENGDYFYVLNVEFIKDSLNKQIFLARVLFTTIGLLILAIAYLVNGYIKKKSLFRSH